MPAVVQEYIATRNILDCQRIQRSILDTYTDDFAKYARKSKHQYLKKIFNSVPGMVGQKFVYSQVDREIKSRELKEALELLETAGVVSRVRQTCGAGLPLAASINETYFKVLFLDVGLLHAISGIYADTAKEKDLTAIFKGAVAEQFAGQELISHQNPFTKPTLYYWGRQAKNSTAEIDYLIELDAQIVPIEIKSGSTGRMKSLHLFIENYHTTRAFKISQAPFLAGKPIISLPFYAIESYFNYRIVIRWRFVAFIQQVNIHSYILLLSCSISYGSRSIIPIKPGSHSWNSHELIHLLSRYLCHARFIRKQTYFKGNRFDRCLPDLCND